MVVIQIAWGVQEFPGAPQPSLRWDAPTNLSILPSGGRALEFSYESAAAHGTRSPRGWAHQRARAAEAMQKAERDCAALAARKRAAAGAAAAGADDEATASCDGAAPRRVVSLPRRAHADEGGGPSSGARLSGCSSPTGAPRGASRGVAFSCATM